MLVLIGMMAAFGGTGSAGITAGLCERVHHRGVGLTGPRESPAEGQTHIGTIKVGANTVRELSHHGLVQAGVGTGRADLGTVEAGLDALHEIIRVIGTAGVRFHHLSGMHGVFSRRFIGLAAAPPRPSDRLEGTCDLATGRMTGLAPGED
jgi:hypothetical protein